MVDVILQQRSASEIGTLSPPYSWTSPHWLPLYQLQQHPPRLRCMAPTCPTCRRARGTKAPIPYSTEAPSQTRLPPWLRTARLRLGLGPELPLGHLQLLGNPTAPKCSRIHLPSPSPVPRKLPSTTFSWHFYSVDGDGSSMKLAGTVRPPQCSPDRRQRYPIPTNRSVQVGRLHLLGSPADSKLLLSSPSAASNCSRAPPRPPPVAPELSLGHLRKLPSSPSAASSCSRAPPRPLPFGHAYVPHGHVCVLGHDALLLCVEPGTSPDCCQLLSPGRQPLDLGQPPPPWPRTAPLSLGLLPLASAPDSFSCQHGPTPTCSHSKYSRAWKWGPFSSSSMQPFKVFTCMEVGGHYPPVSMQPPPGSTTPLSLSLSLSALCPSLFRSGWECSFNGLN